MRMNATPPGSTKTLQAQGALSERRVLEVIGQTVGALLGGCPGVRALAGLYAAYMVSAAFGRWMMVVPDLSITIWPPNGVILAMLLMHNRNTWPWWLMVGALGELTGNVLWYQNHLAAAIGYIAANAAAVIAAGSAFALYIGGPIRQLETLRQVLTFIGVAVVAAPIISATIGTSVIVATQGNAFGEAWLAWWLGDATGALITTPLLISVIDAWRQKLRPSGWRLPEGLAIALTLVGLSAWDLSSATNYTFLLPLPVIWAALRFELHGATLSMLVLTVVIGIHANGINTVHVSPDAIAQMHNRMQALIIAATSIGLIVAVITRQQRQAASNLARLNAELETRVLERTHVIEKSRRRFEATFQNAGAGMSILGKDGSFLRVNDSLVAMLGYSPEELEGKRLEDFTHPEDRTEGEAVCVRLASGACDEHDAERRYIRKDGRTVWGHTTVSCVRRVDGGIDYLVAIIQDISDRKRSEESLRYLMREVNHRSKNLLSVVQVIARQSARDLPGGFTRTFTERLQALAVNQDILVNNGWHPIDLGELVRSQLEHFGEIGTRVVMFGPSVTINPSAAQALGMALHELATNAAKYGSLSNDEGVVTIRWSAEGDDFQMSWAETDGPEVVEPIATGFGTTVIDKLTSSTLGGEVKIDYNPEGVFWAVDCPISSLR